MIKEGFPLLHNYGKETQSIISSLCGLGAVLASVTCCWHCKGVGQAWTYSSCYLWLLLTTKKGKAVFSTWCLVQQSLSQMEEHSPISFVRNLSHGGSLCISAAPFPRYVWAVWKAWLNLKCKDWLKTGGSEGICHQWLRHLVSQRVSVCSQTSSLGWPTPCQALRCLDEQDLIFR